MPPPLAKPSLARGLRNSDDRPTDPRAGTPGPIFEAQLKHDRVHPPVYRKITVLKGGLDCALQSFILALGRKIGQDIVERQTAIRRRDFFQLTIDLFVVIDVQVVPLQKLVVLVQITSIADILIGTTYIAVTVRESHGNIDYPAIIRGIPQDARLRLFPFQARRIVEAHRRLASHPGQRR